MSTNDCSGAIRMDHSDLRAIVDLLPRYAFSRRAGWSPASLTTDGISLNDYLLLRRAAIERRDEPVSLEELRAHALDPYGTNDPLLDRLPLLVEAGLIDQVESTYSLTSSGNNLLAIGERQANDFASQRIQLPESDLARLAWTLDDVVRRLHASPEPATKHHQDRVPNLRRFDPRTTPSVVLEYALYAMQRARDDAYISAWTAAGFQGPSIEVLSRVWTGEASTMKELLEITSHRLRSTDVPPIVSGLLRQGYIESDGIHVWMTNHGRRIRDQVEHETDRIYFAPWPTMDSAWIRDRLTVLTNAMPSGSTLS